MSKTLRHTTWTDGTPLSTPLSNRLAADGTSAFKARGNAAFGRHEWARACSYYSQALRTSSSSSSATKTTRAILHANRAAALSRLLLFPRALVDVEAALQLQPTHAKALKRRADLLKTLGGADACKAILQQPTSSPSSPPPPFISPKLELARSAAQGRFVRCRADASVGPGEVVLDIRTLEIPADAPPGSYTLAAGLYHHGTGERLVLANGETIVLITPLKLELP